MGFALCSILRQTWEFPKIRVPYFGVRIIRILQFRVQNLGYHIRVPYFRKPPHTMPTATRCWNALIGASRLRAQGQVQAVQPLVVSRDCPWSPAAAISSRPFCQSLQQRAVALLRSERFEEAQVELRRGGSLTIGWSAASSSESSLQIVRQRASCFTRLVYFIIPYCTVLYYMATETRVYDKKQ